jgi:ATP-dependent exoDNAse (exonuclease V) alpha subunit
MNSLRDLDAEVQKGIIQPSKDIDIASTICNKLINGRQSIFLTGAGGVGKTYTTNQVKRKLYNCITLASTGVASLLIQGQTVHSFFKLGVSKSLGELKLLDRKNITEFAGYKHISEAEAYRIYFYKLDQALDAAQAIIIDEVSMLTGKMLDMIYYRLEQFGAEHKPILLVGDLLQLPPVKSESLLIHSPHFEKFETIYLTEVKRTADLDFIEVQHKLREGVVDDAVTAFMKKHDRTLSKEERATHVNLFSLKASAAAYNKSVLRDIDSKLFKVTTKIVEKDDRVSNQEATNFINDLLVGAELEIKVGCRVMFVKNSYDFVNGELGTLMEIDLEDKALIVQKDNGIQVRVYKDKFEKFVIDGYRGELKLKKTITATNYPIVLAAGVSIHKSQGLTIPKLYLDLERVFERSQLYVGVSRASDPKNLIIKNFHPSLVKVNKEILKWYRSL